MCVSPEDSVDSVGHAFDGRCCCCCCLDATRSIANFFVFFGECPCAVQVCLRAGTLEIIQGSRMVDGGEETIEHTIGVLPHPHHCKGEGQSAAEKRAGYATLLCYSTHAVPVSVVLFVTFSEQRQWKGKEYFVYLFLPPKECGNKRETTRTKCEGCSHRRRDLRVLLGGSGRHRVGSTYIFPKVCNSWDVSECALKRSWQFNRLVPSF